jgi:DnaJ-class molecular chaperone
MGKLLTKIEAACLLCVSVELLDFFTARCPKPKEKRKLEVAQLSEEVGQLFDQDEVMSFAKYLNEPWPTPPKGGRPHLPEEIKADIAKESHLTCAICGLMMNCEVAHIESVSETLNNGPDNLIYLCPNHHTEYDYGFKPGSNVTIEEVQAAKRIKRNSRRRTMRFEENAAKVLHTVIKLAKALEKDLKAEDNRVVREAGITELKSLLTQVPNLVSKAQAQAEKDQPADEVTTAILEQATQLARTTIGIGDSSTERDVRHSASQLADLGADIELDLDEVECPHCGGRGTTGLMGSFCNLCKGRTVVSEAEADAYSPDTYDEVQCPHCYGRGTTGLVDDICAFCRGNCYVSREDAEAYDRDEIDEIECPHCGGRGTTGLIQHFCSVCTGSCVVSHEEAEQYDPSEIDEVECPRCGGRGVKGLSNDYCAFCGGNCFVSRKEAREYAPDNLDEVECPHCHGSGRKGHSNYYCALCLGAMVVSREEAEEYDPDEIDEVDCPHCNGSGRIGEYECKECYGACVVSSEDAAEYEDRREELVECPHCEGTGVKGLQGDLCNLCKGDKVVGEDVYSAYRNKYS